MGSKLTGLLLIGSYKKIYKTTVQDIDHLKARITQEIETIEKEPLYNVFLEISKRRNFCISIKGDTCEQYL